MGRADVWLDGHRAHAVVLDGRWHAHGSQVDADANAHQGYRCRFGCVYSVEVRSLSRLALTSLPLAGGDGHFAAAQSAATHELQRPELQRQTVGAHGAHPTAHRGGRSGHGAAEAARRRLRQIQDHPHPDVRESDERVVSCNSNLILQVHLVPALLDASTRARLCPCALVVAYCGLWGWCRCAPPRARPPPQHPNPGVAKVVCAFSL